MKTDYARHDHVYQRKYNDPNYAGWNTHTDTEEDLQLSWQPLFEKPSFPKQGKLLELGCGAGNVSIFLAQKGYEVIGIDISPTAIQWAIENARNAQVNVQFFTNDVLALPEVPKASFDVVLDGRCLHCIIGHDRAHFLQTAYRVLKPNGILTVNSMCNEVPDTPYFQEHFAPQSRCLIHDGLANRYIGDSNSILQEVMQAGFRLLDVEVLAPKNHEDVSDLKVIARKL